jgi:hypothetical protein
MTSTLTPLQDKACPLARAEEALISRVGRPLTLNPDREQATLPSKVVAGLLEPGDDALTRASLRVGLARLIEAQLAAFPENLFWDVDSLVASVLREARASEEQTAVAIHEAFDRIAALQHLFGQGTPVRFRYIHDFIYGYDWARWVRQAPAEREGVGPFDRVFIERMHRRGNELLALIAKNDGKYPRLGSSGARNPFGFSREPDAEISVHRALASDGLLPVSAWSVSRAAIPRIDFYARRCEVAKRLGLATS